jgi:hypothetical protein
MDSNHVFRMCRNEHIVSYFYVSCNASQSTTHATHFIQVCRTYQGKKLQVAEKIQIEDEEYIIEKQIFFFLGVTASQSEK